MPTAAIEHVNLTVSDPERTAALMADLFGWHERWRGPAMGGGFTIHVGSDAHYLALYTGPADEQPGGPWEKGMPLNHVGIVVDDLGAVEARAIAAGLTPFSHGDYEPGRRFYLFDGDGIEYEVVSYGS
jgi:glyoxylase I family protein